MSQAQRIQSQPMIWLLVIVIWLILYFTDWTAILNNDILQTIAGIFLFLVPGAIFGILYCGEIKWTQFFALGLVFSSLIALLLAICALALGFSSDTFQLLFKVTSTLSLLLLIQRRDQVHVQRWEHSPLTYLEVVLFGLGIISAIGLLLVMSDLSSIDGDYNTYNAMITEFAASSRLTLQDPFLGTNNLIKSRLWLVGWLIDQSLIIEFSQLNILQNFHYINLLLVFLVYTVIYDLIRRFGIPRKFAILIFVFTNFAILSQLYNSQIGEVFIHRLAQDKVITAWVLAPIFVRIVYDFLTDSNWRTGGLVIVVSIVTVNFHAVIFVYIAMIVGVFVVLYVMFHSHRWQHIIFVGVVVTLSALIPFMLRQVAPDDFIFESTDILNSGEEPEAFARLTLSDDGILYGIASFLRDGTAFSILFLALLIALIRIRYFVAGYYIIACLVVLFSVSNPITAPLLGKVISPFQLWRAPWLMPFGIASVVLLREIDRYSHKLSEHIRHIVLLVIAIGFTVTTINLSNTYIQHRLTNPPKNSYSQKQQIYNDLVKIGDLMRSQNSTESITVFADNPIMYLIPSIDANIHALIWHNPSQIRMTYDELVEREIDHNRFYADDITLDEFHMLLDKYKIDYLILSSTFIRPLNSLLEKSPCITDKQTYGSITLWTVKHQS